jgi:hypothetical protein
MISIRVWFVLESEKLYLLPVTGSDTQWYKKMLKNPTIRIDTRDVGEEFRAVFDNRCQDGEICDWGFREKYGAEGGEEVLFEIRLAVVVQLT